MTTDMKRHWYGLTDRMANPSCVRWVEVVSIGPAIAALEAEAKNPGFTAHSSYVIDHFDDLQHKTMDEIRKTGLAVWRVELWPHRG